MGVRCSLERFDICVGYLGRYVRQKSTGKVGWVARDPGNGWLHPTMCYEWEYSRDDFEYVNVNGIDYWHNPLSDVLAEALAKVSK